MRAKKIEELVQRIVTEEMGKFAHREIIIGNDKRVDSLRCDIGTIDRHINSEQFIDDIVERIKRKQLK